MIPLEKKPGLWITILVLTLFTTFAESQHLATVDRQTKNRIPSRTASTIRNQGNRPVARNDPGNFKRLPLTLRRTNLLINARVSSVQNCDGSSCLPLFPPLPVKLLVFNGMRLDQTQIQLSWTTSEEVHNDHFEVERTLNPATGFQVVGSVSGKIHSSQNVSYTFTDPNIEEVYTYYRLKQVDIDGSRSYSRIIGIKGFRDVLSVVPFPNPSSAKDLKFRVLGHHSGESLRVEVYDVTGKIIYQNQEYILSDDKHISLQSLRSTVGLFVIKIKNTQQQASSSFVLVN
jgi:hypothetical protein